MADIQQKSRSRKLIPLKYSCEEVYERMENGLCIFCEEKDSPEHQKLKHKGIQIVCVEDDQMSEAEEISLPKTIDSFPVEPLHTPCVGVNINEISEMLPKHQGIQIGIDEEDRISEIKEEEDLEIVSLNGDSEIDHTSFSDISLHSSLFVNPPVKRMDEGRQKLVNDNGKNDACQVFDKMSLNAQPHESDPSSVIMPRAPPIPLQSPDPPDFSRFGHVSTMNEQSTSTTIEVIQSSIYQMEEAVPRLVYCGPEPIRFSVSSRHSFVSGISPRKRSRRFLAVATNPDSNPTPTTPPKSTTINVNGSLSKEVNNSVTINLFALYAFSSHSQANSPLNHHSNSISLVSQHLSLILKEIDSSQRKLAQMEKQMLGYESIDISRPKIVPELKLFLQRNQLPLGKDSRTGITEMVSSVGHSCEKSADLLSQYMSYKVLDRCPDDWSLGQKLILRACEPLPRRRCLAKTVQKKDLTRFPDSLWRTVSNKSINWSGLGCKSFDCLKGKKISQDCVGCFDLGNEKDRFVKVKGKNDFLVDECVARFFEELDYINQRSVMETRFNDDAGDVSSIEIAELAGDLLDVKWSTNIYIWMSMKGGIEKGSLQMLVDSNSILETPLVTSPTLRFVVEKGDYKLEAQTVQVTEDSDVVFYMGATDLCSLDYFDCYKVIVQGTKNVIFACRESGVSKLIYNSTTDVVLDGHQPIRDGDESLIRPLKLQSILTDFKAQAEALVKFANNHNGLLTCALRSSIVLGPGDTEFVPFLVNLAKHGYAKFIIGSGENMCDFTYSENVSHAHICAAEALDSQMEFVAGKEFFITNFKPIRFWDFASRIVEGLGYPRPYIKLPARLVLPIFSFLKWIQEQEGLRSNYDRAHQFALLASSTRTFNCNAAKQYLGYIPVVTLEISFLAAKENMMQFEGHRSVGDFSEYHGQSATYCVSSESTKRVKMVFTVLVLWKEEPPDNIIL